MLRKTLTGVLSAVLLFSAFGMNVVLAQTGDAKAEKARARVEKLGTGRQAKVEVKLRDNTKLKGYVSQAGTNDFTVTDAKTGTSRIVAYSDVEKVSKRGGGLSTGAWIAIIAGTGAAITVGAILRSIYCNEQAC